jgi:hypothetical protein
MVNSAPTAGEEMVCEAFKNYWEMYEKVIEQQLKSWGTRKRKQAEHASQPEHAVPEPPAPAPAQKQSLGRGRGRGRGGGRGRGRGESGPSTFSVTSLQ